MSSTQAPAQRRRSPILPTLGVAAVLVVLFVLFTQLWTDRLWFQALGYSQVYGITLLTRVGLFVGFGLITAGIVVGNIASAFRLRPPMRSAEVTSDLLERGRELLETRLVQVLIGIGVVIGLFAGTVATSQTTTFLAWLKSTPFGTADPRFGIDISFFVFDYPWYRLVASSLMTALVLSAIGAALVHYMMGALRYARGRRLATNKAAAHVSILLGATLLLYAVQQWLDRYAFQLTNDGLLTGLTYTDDNARITAKTILTAIAVLCALVFFANAVLRRWIFPVLATALLVLSGIVVGAVYPAVVQGISVRPDEPDKERPYIERHIQATRDAYDVAGVEIEDYTATTDAKPGQLKADAEALPGIRLIDPAVVGPTYEQLQQVRGYYAFNKPLDVDRYTIDGEETDAVVAVREMDIGGLENQSWNNVRTVYTHGYGLVSAYGNRRQASGEPDWISKDIPPVGEINQPEPRVYYGEIQDDYSIVGRQEGEGPLELDTPGGGEGSAPQLTTYAGTGGVGVGNLVNRLLYATRFADANILLSDRVNDQSKIIYDRTPKERVQAAAPWLTTDSDTYPAVVEGRIVWIVDGYTTSNSYPNSQRLSMVNATDGQTAPATLGNSVNYVRNSVKAVVDAYDGTVTLYEWDTEDPILKTWQKVFPDSVKAKSEISDDLLAHLRYPMDLFKLQREILARYHVTDPALWYQQSDLWQIPADPVATSGANEQPYYLSVKWPGDDDAIFSNTAVYVPNGRSNLAAYMAVNAEGSSPDYGQLRILRMSDTRQIDGPGQTFNAITNDTAVAQRLRLFIQGSAQVTYGNLLTLPVGGGLLYVQPVYTQREGSEGSYPLLRFVVVRFGETVGTGDTLQEALDEVFQGDAGVDTGEEPIEGGVPGDPADPANPPPDPSTPADPPTDPPAEPPTGKVDEAAANKALDEATKAYADAEKALKDGDLAEYQKQNKAADAAIKRAVKALGR